MSEKPISPLRRRMLDDMTMRRFTPDTQRDYKPHRQHGAVSRSLRQTSQQRLRQAAPRRNPHSAHGSAATHLPRVLSLKAFRRRPRR
jgi:hypothetical protein